MRASIELIGPLRYGREMVELQAVILTADGKFRTLHWSLHSKEKDAIEYRDRFNNNQAK